MGDYIYGYRTSDGHVLFDDRWSAEEMRRFPIPVQLPVSAIEPLPEPKPVLPTTPGSVVRHGVLWLLDDDGSWYYKEAMMTRDSMNSGDFKVVFDAGAHDEGKAETDKDADEPYYQAICGSWDCRAPECNPKDI